MKGPRPAALSAFVLALMVQFCAFESKTDSYPPDGTARIIRDDYGVAHIFASNEADLMYGFGYATAQDRARQVARSALTAAGRLAEVEGEDALRSDITLRGFRLRETAAERLPDLPPRFSVALEAYCRGYNKWVAENRDGLPDWVAELSPADVLSTAMLINFDFATRSLAAVESKLKASGVGSNQFAVAPRRSASGKALLSMDPHLPFDGPLRWSEAHLSCPQYSATGAVVPGQPVIAMGHNGKVAWCFTTNYPDTVDLYAFKLDPDRPGRYLAADGWRELESRSEKFTILGANGASEHSEDMLGTHVGPVLAVEGGVVYAARYATAGEAGIIEQFFRILEAPTAAELIEAFRTPGFVNQNVVAADVAGNIAYLYNARCPRRDPGLDWDRAVPGEDPRSVWSGYVEFDKLPRVVNPPAGWLQNCNNPPKYVTENSGIEPSALPFRLCTQGDRLNDRGLRLIELLSADDSVTFDEAVTYACDNLVMQARWWVPRLVEAFQTYRDRMGLADSKTAAAIETLGGWDFHADADSAAMTLFHAWQARNDGRNMQAIYSGRMELSEDIKQKQLSSWAWRWWISRADTVTIVFLGGKCCVCATATSRCLSQPAGSSRPCALAGPIRNFRTAS